MMNMSSTLGNQELYRQSGNNETQLFSPKGHDIKKMIHQDLPEQKPSQTGEVQVMQFNFQSKAGDPGLFAKKCKQQGYLLVLMLAST